MEWFAVVCFSLSFALNIGLNNLSLSEDAPPLYIYIYEYVYLHTHMYNNNIHNINVNNMCGIYIYIYIMNICIHTASPHCAGPGLWGVVGWWVVVVVGSRRMAIVNSILGSLRVWVRCLGGPFGFNFGPCRLQMGDLGSQNAGVATGRGSRGIRFSPGRLGTPNWVQL